jgi:RNA polymerase sigma-70 factor (ECF subfamily)
VAPSSDRAPGRTKPAPRPAEALADGPPDAFLRACHAAGVPASEHAALWELHRRGPTPTDLRQGALQPLLDDWGHWQLYRRSRAGDEAAATEFERYWRKQVLAFCGPRFARDQAEELVARFFERVYRLVRDEFRWHCPFIAYLRTILLNLSRDHVGRLVRQRAREARLEDAEAGPGARLLSADPSPERLLIEEEERERVGRALAALAPGDRHLLVQSLIEGRSGDDMAQELGIARDAVHQRLSRARRRLKELVLAEGRR